jgi:predicted esterase
MGPPLAEARAAMVMVHGRGASAESILALSRELESDDVAYLAPQAAGGTWYPYGFMSPIAINEPGITSALRSITRTIGYITAAGIPHERTFLLGFSQGACLATEYLARNARRYGGLAALSGGLIGPSETPRDYAGSLDGTPTFLGCSDVDGHIPAARVLESATVLRRLGGEVTLRLYPGMGHLVNGDEIESIRTMLAVALRGE